MASELDPPAEALFRSSAEAVVDAAPGDWRSAVLTCEGGRDVRLTYERPGGLDEGHTPDVDREALRGLSARFGGVDVELIVQADGTYEAVLTRGGAQSLASGPGRHVHVLDPAYRPPQPGEEQDGPQDPSPAGDATEAARLLREVLRLKSEIVGRVEAPRAPASPETIKAFAAWAGVTPPADLLALYEVADGDPLMFYGYEWLPLGELMTAGHLRARDRSWPGWLLGWNEAVLDADPPGIVRRVTGHPGWVPFAHDGGGNYLAVDMAPASHGRPGQVIRMGREYGDGPGYVADSVTGLLRRELDALERGDYDAEEEGYIELAGPEFDETVALNAREHRIDARRATLNSVHGGVQRLVVSHGGDLDLGGLQNAPHLHDLDLTCRTPDLAVVKGLPLDNLTLSVEEVDLARLAGHPTLRTFTLRTERPVDVTALSSLPLLNGLDLSGAVVTDLGPLTEIRTLRFLALTEAQWETIGEVPSLAAAGLHGDVPRAAAFEWADRFHAGRPATVLRHSGRLLR